MKKPKPPTLPRGMVQSRSAWRWIPRPELRKAGWKAITLKNKDGTNLTMGQAVDACDAINRAVNDWKDHGLHPTGWIATIAPHHAARPVSPTGGNHSIGALIDAFMQTDHVTKDISPVMRSDYRIRLKRLVDVLAGYAALPPRGDPEAQAVYAAAVAKVRALPVTILAMENGKGDTFLQQAYNDMAAQRNTRGELCLHAAKAMIVHARPWLEWVRKKTRAITVNPAADVEMRAVKGRKVLWTQPEIDMVLAVAHEWGFHSIADAMEVALELSWDQKSILPMQLRQHYTFTAYNNMGLPYRAGRIAGTRSKTDNATHTTLTDEGLHLFDRIIARAHARVGEGVTMHPTTPLFVVDHVPGRNDQNRYGREAIGKPWKGDYFRHVLLEIRQEAAKRLGLPSIDKTFQDLRDTAFTRMKEAGLNKHQIASRTQQSPVSIDRLDEKHYGIVTINISDQAADLMNRHARRLRSSHMCEDQA